MLRGKAWSTQPSHCTYAWLFAERSSVTSQTRQNLSGGGWGWESASENSNLRDSKKTNPTLFYSYLHMSVVFTQHPAHHQLPHARDQSRGRDQLPAACPHLPGKAIFPAGIIKQARAPVPCQWLPHAGRKSREQKGACCSSRFSADPATHL